jgi:GDP/UDP-N,N'-diacetylbacillosamine 2-epimerase (hydrolysing)
MRKVCVVTGARSEYGLLRWLLADLQQSTQIELQLVVTGTHVAPAFDLTYREIEADGFKIVRKMEMLLSSDTAVGVTKSVGVAILGFADLFEDLKPDMLLILGDRYEIFAAASAAMLAAIPIAHIHGGEATYGATDEAIRHAITKMSHLHFVAAPEYRRRVIQLGESPDRVFLVGGLVIDNIQRFLLLDKVELEKALDFKFGQKNILVTFHPTTLERNSSNEQIEALLASLEICKDVHIIFTMPNADVGNHSIVEKIEYFVKKNPDRAKVFASLGSLRYLSCLRHVDAVVGNSSSGIIEAPSFKKGTINIGDRQSGRVQASSVINCLPTTAEITRAMTQLYSKEFQETLPSVSNPYDQGGASKKIVQVIEQSNLKDILKKTFFDTPTFEHRQNAIK